MRVVHRSTDMRDLFDGLTRALADAVPFDGACLLTLDPATLLPTNELVRDGLPPETLPRLTEIELCEPDYNKFTTLARLPVPCASLNETTRGVLDHSRRQRELRRPSGFDDELRLVCGDTTGAWGALTLLRERGRPPFAAADVQFVASLSGLLAEGVRRGTLLTEPPADDHRDRTGVVVLTADNTIQMTNPAGNQWLDELAAPEAPAELPVVVLAVAARARRISAISPDHRDDLHSPADAIATARIRTHDRHWATVRGSVLGDHPQAPVAVLIEHAHAPDLAPIVADAYHLTPRERRVTELVARGLPTDDIAADLHLSAYTVQDHLKSIFAKTGSSSRGELVARLFFDHYAPKLQSPHTPD